MKEIPINRPKEPIKLKVNLEYMSSPVFRRILVPDDINMMQLHFVIQLAMGWQFAHLFQFSDRKADPTIRVKIPFDDDYDAFFPFRRTETFKPEEVTLKKEFQLARDSKPFYYAYDFGDDWLHRITFQKPSNKDREIFTGIPVCVNATGACPPEDIGGPWGFADFLEAMNNKKHPELEEYREWMGLEPNEEFDLEFVDIDGINNSLESYYQGPEKNITSKEYFHE